MSTRQSFFAEVLREPDTTNVCLGMLFLFAGPITYALPGIGYQSLLFMAVGAMLFASGSAHKAAREAVEQARIAEGEE